MIPRNWLDDTSNPGLNGTFTVSRTQIQPNTLDGHTPHYGPRSGGKPREIRNNIPVLKPYRYAGLGESMSADEAWFWLKRMNCVAFRPQMAREMASGMTQAG